MESKAKLFGHPIHQMLIVFPLGLLATALFFDIIALVMDRHDGLFTASFYMIAAGIISGLVAGWLARRIARGRYGIRNGVSRRLLLPAPGKSAQARWRGNRRKGRDLVRPFFFSALSSRSRISARLGVRPCGRFAQGVARVP